MSHYSQIKIGDDESGRGGESQNEFYFNISSLPTSTQICANVLQHLAMGPTRKLNATTNQTSFDQEQERLLNVALSILVDATSPGPDPLALEYLGWAYGMGGGGGGMGDWNGCHNLPGDIGLALRNLQEEETSLVRDSSSKYIDVTKFETMGRSTRFCTIGDIPPDTIPYNDKQIGWQPPVAGVCIPSSCDANSLYTLFGDFNFEKSLLHLAALQADEDMVASDLIISQNDPFTANISQRDTSLIVEYGNLRRYRYFSSLARSFRVGLLFKRGVICEGNTGLPELDYNTRGWGYHCTISLMFFLLSCVVLGTILKPFRNERTLSHDNNEDEDFEAEKDAKLSDQMKDESITTTNLINRSRNGTHQQASRFFDEHYKNDISLSKSNFENESLDQHPKTFIPIIDSSTVNNDTSDLLNQNINESTLLNQRSSHQYSSYDENKSDDYGIVHDIEETIEKNQQEGILTKTLSSNPQQDQRQKLPSLPHQIISRIATSLEYFDAKQSFYEITRMKQEDVANLASVVAHEQTLRNSGGEIVLDSYNSNPGLLPMASILDEESRNIEKSIRSNIHHDHVGHKVRHGSALSNINQETSEENIYNDEDIIANDHDYASTFDALLVKNESSNNQISPSRPKNKETNTNITPPTTSSVSSSKCLNGMRSISMLWIILGHMVAKMSSIGYDNPAALLPPEGMLKSALGMLIFSARFAVDTFFFIGGYLVMSGILKRLDPTLSSLSKTNDRQIHTRTNSVPSPSWNVAFVRWGIINPSHVVLGDYVQRLHKSVGMKDNPIDNLLKRVSSAPNSQDVNIKWVFPFLLHRIMRILPTYAFVLLFGWKVAVTLNEGPFWPRWAPEVAACDARAWSNLLFVNNFVPWSVPFGEGRCMYHAWYLAVDFQLCALLTPPFVTLYFNGLSWFSSKNEKNYFGERASTDYNYRSRLYTIIAELAFVLLVIVVSFMESLKHDWSANLFDGMQTESFDRDFYVNPFYRSSPYIMGFVAAQLWHEKCRLNPNLGFTKKVAFFLSLFGVLIMLFLTFCGMSAYDERPCLVWESTHGPDHCGSGWTKRTLAAYASFTRPAWGFGLAILSLLSFNGQLDCFGISSVLSWSGWDPIGKLSFGMYLIHPYAVQIWLWGRSSKNFYSNVGFLYSFVAVVGMTFFSALLTGIMVEWPISKFTRDVEHYLIGKRKVR